MSWQSQGTASRNWAAASLGSDISAALSDLRKRGTTDVAKVPELAGRGQRHSEVRRSREPLFPGGIGSREPANEQRLECAEIEHRLVDVEDDGTVHEEGQEGRYQAGEVDQTCDRGHGTDDG